MLEYIEFGWNAIVGDYGILVFILGALLVFSLFMNYFLASKLFSLSSEWSEVLVKMEINHKNANGVLEFLKTEMAILKGMFAILAGQKDKK